MTYESISGTHGAYTRYRIAPSALKSLSVDLNRHRASLISRDKRFDSSSFRWFTREETDQGVSDGGERIMQKYSDGTPSRRREADAFSVPNARPRAHQLGLWRLFQTTYTLRQLVLFSVVLVCAYLLFFQFDSLYSFLKLPSQLLVNSLTLGQDHCCCGNPSVLVWSWKEPGMVLE